MKTFLLVGIAFVFSAVLRADVTDGELLRNLPEGSALELLQPINIAPKYNEICFREGKLSMGYCGRYSRVDYCSFKLKAHSKDDRLVRASPTRLTLVSGHEDSWTSSGERFKLHFHRRVTYTLQNTNTLANVSCVFHDTEPFKEKQDPTIADLRRHLGAYFTLQLPTAIEVGP